MRRFLMQHQKERFVFGTSLQKLNSKVCRDVGAMSFEVDFLAGDKKGGIPVSPLPWQNNPAIEARGI